MGRGFAWPIHVVRRGRSLFTSQKQKAMGHLTEAQYKIIADRMIEEHRKYGDRLRPGHWADVAARKVASHMADFREGERVFTESEVRAMMDDVKAIAADHSRKCYTNRIEQMTPPAPVAFHIDNYLWKSHGFSFDPA